MRRRTAPAAFGSIAPERAEESCAGARSTYVARYGTSIHLATSRAPSAHRIPPVDRWLGHPLGGPGRPERGSISSARFGGATTSSKLQSCRGETGTLFVQCITPGQPGRRARPSRPNYFALAKDREPVAGPRLDLGYFTPARGLAPPPEATQRACAAAQLRDVNRPRALEQIAEAFRRRLLRRFCSWSTEVSHTWCRAVRHPTSAPVWVQPQGATRAFPGGHPALAGTIVGARRSPRAHSGEQTDYSYVLASARGRAQERLSVNHGAGRRMSRGEATRLLDQHRSTSSIAGANILVNLDGEVLRSTSLRSATSRSRRSCARSSRPASRASEHTLWPVASLKGTEEGSASTSRRERKEKSKSREREREEARRRRAPLTTPTDPPWTRCRFHIRARPARRRSARRVAAFAGAPVEHGVSSCASRVPWCIRLEPRAARHRSPAGTRHGSWG